MQDSKYEKPLAGTVCIIPFWQVHIEMWNNDSKYKSMYILNDEDDMEEKFNQYSIEFDNVQLVIVDRHEEIKMANYK